MSEHEARPGLVTALCAAVQAVGGGLGWSLLPPLMATIGAELSISHALGGLVWGAASLGIVVVAATVGVVGGAGRGGRRQHASPPALIAAARRRGAG